MELITYKKFNDEETALAIGDLLKENGVLYEIENTNTFFNPEFSYNKANFNVLLKLKGEDFEKASLFIEKFYESSIDRLDKDYYLFQFSNPELLEILQKSDEWGELDAVLAKKLLKDRGSVFTDDDIQNLKNQRIEVLAKPQKAGIDLMIVGYASAIVNLIMLFFPSLIRAYTFYSIVPFLLSIFVIWSLLYFKKTLPNGEQVYVYEESSHKHAIIIIFLLIVSLIKLFFNLFFSNE
jgi:hypothetical protein